ncbi:MAG TPA: carboxypeptidase-like regulatory domain-containing protein, partial [Longimicrobiaceae bacterium]|nr:carboxypeptidase-like regulatory domain-containing protein [Longimicrobiaceae bacterium]
LAAAAPAAGQSGRIVGRVTDPIGRPVEGATVVLVSAEAGQAPRTARSGETGGFEFAGVPAGSYTLRVERPGFRPRETPVAVEAGELRTVVARLEPGGRRGAALAENP